MDNRSEERGRRGATQLLLPKAEEPSVRQALIAAWRNVAPTKLTDQFPELRIE